MQTTLDLSKAMEDSQIKESKHWKRADAILKNMMPYWTCLQL